ncbi:unnamed protein product [Didymodactylos carnosus]|uniref:Uncharacterized protein n=1 Tax=Didymodactylos carnosus TaxID=1234261 RepID=A0A813SMY6_9BILA|nr:unnamed protein product [Didymodactylos carnosus]CAF0797394.1 unnamed protein product [Didymodactylos carnosus]CAF3518349.1 unnamed protein product [Didymodactylos carnosus]CAF3582161.1 unnamed protein product [Didymodactylos carnosus]
MEGSNKKRRLVCGDSSIRVENRGGYVMRLLVTYESEGQSKVQNTGTYPVFQSRTITIPEGSRSVEIEAQADVFVNSFRTIFKTSNQCPQTRCFVVWGTTFNSAWSEQCC